MFNIKELDETKIFTYSSDNKVATVFVQEANNVYITCLAGIMCGISNRELMPERVKGLSIIDWYGKLNANKDFELINSSFLADAIYLSWLNTEASLQLESKWLFDYKTGVWSRNDILTNLGDTDKCITNSSYRFTFAPGRYELYSQGSYWCNENQGSWKTIDHGGIRLGTEGGRTCLGGTPFAYIRDVDSQNTVAFHILPVGNWALSATASTAPADSNPFLTVELGLSNSFLQVELKAGDKLNLPEIIIHPVLFDGVCPDVSMLHKYLLQRQQNHNINKKAAPVVYNTWFDVFEELHVDRLRQQLATAKRLGCEIFVIDAGWYGAGEGMWSIQTGDWREKQKGAFYGRMLDFANEVRSCGMEFGLWMEPENIGNNAPILIEHPEWFISTGNGYKYPDLTKKEVYNYMLGEMSRLVETYGLKWMKIDFNFELGADPYRSELNNYYKAWFSLLKEFANRHEELFIEGCASGGLRLDINTLEHFDSHFLTDTVNPWEVLRIYQGVIMRALPGRITRWAVLRPAGGEIPQYGVLLKDSPKRIVTPDSAVWDTSIIVNVDFAALIAMPGMFGLSGDIANLDTDAQQRLQYHIAFFKQWREFIYNSTGHLLTPIKQKNDNTGWAALQLQDIEETKALVFVYRLADGTESKQIRLKNLNESAEYIVKLENGSNITSNIYTGKELMNQGLTTTLYSKNSACVYSIASDL